MTVNVYFDVDGVFNAMPSRTTQLEGAGWSKDSWNREVINGYTINWSSELVDAVNKLARHENVEVKWLTTWCHEAPLFIAPGLNLETGADWPVVGERVNVYEYGPSYFVRTPGSYGYWWKAPQIIKDVELTDPEKVVWVDDHLSLFFADNVAPWARVMGDRLLTVAPTDYLGITKDEMDLIFEFVDAE